MTGWTDRRGALAAMMVGFIAVGGVGLTVPARAGDYKTKEELFRALIPHAQPATRGIIPNGAPSGAGPKIHTRGIGLQTRSPGAIMPKVGEQPKPPAKLPPRQDAPEPGKTGKNTSIANVAPPPAGDGAAPTTPAAPQKFNKSKLPNFGSQVLRPAQPVPPQAPAALPQAGQQVASTANARPLSTDVKIYFAYDSSKITWQAQQQLDTLGEMLADNRAARYRFKIIGHTDARGEAAYNYRLSKRRAAAVLAYLVKNFHIDRRRLISLGRGESQLLDPDHPNADKNRRVQVVNIGAMR